jgi:hypothetical protein
MKKMLILVAVVIFWSGAAGAAESFLGEWQYKNSEGSVIYIFEPAQVGQIAGQGKIIFIPSSEQSKQSILPFLYVIERKITAKSSIDTFWEYILKIWFPSQNAAIVARISLREGKVSISEGDRKVVLTRR